MIFLYSDDPIVACSSGSQANAAIAVIRISGFESLSSLNNFFQLDLSGPIEPRRVYYTKLVLQGHFIDDVCLTYFAGPRSYNGENILELSVHGNTLNIDRILTLFTTHAGCRIAQPGEFTYRALRNKKLTLSQVEGLDLFLNANSNFALDQGLSLLSGNLHDVYQELYDLFLLHKSSLELLIDFSEDIGEEAARNYFLESLSRLSHKFVSLEKRVLPLDHNLICPEVVISGLPNAGKSSLFNFLLSDDRAIVSPVPGTTRDFLGEMIFIDGIKFRLVDTAGIRESDDLIENEGVKRSKKKLTEGFFSILLINPFEMLPTFETFRSSHFDLIFFTHRDLPGFDEAVASVITSHPWLGPTGAIDLNFPPADFEISINQKINEKYLRLVQDKPILLSRHRELILTASLKIKEYQILAVSETDVGVLSQELSFLGHCVSELLGIVSPDQVLNSIFSNFCIGK